MKNIEIVNTISGIGCGEAGEFWFATEGDNITFYNELYPLPPVSFETTELELEISGGGPVATVLVGLQEARITQIQQLGDENEEDNSSN